MKPNIELMKRLRTRFLRMRHREHFRMNTVVSKTECGTAMCIAGHALDLQGYKFKFSPDSREAVAYLSPRGRKVEDPLEQQRGKWAWTTKTRRSLSSMTLILKRPSRQRSESSS